MLISVASLEKNHEVAMLGQYNNFWSRFHNTRASMDLPPLKVLEKASDDLENNKDDLEAVVDKHEEQEQNIKEDNERKISQTDSDEGFGDSLSLGYEKDEQDNVDIFTKSMDINNLDLRNFLMTGDRKKKISDISEIMAFNNELRRKVYYRRRHSDERSKHFLFRNKRLPQEWTKLKAKVSSS